MTSLRNATRTIKRLPPALLLCTLLGVLPGLSGCTTTVVDELRVAPGQLELSGPDSIVVLGRRHSGGYATEPGFIDCIGGRLSRADGMRVIGELEFVNALYPWFEPRTAPMTPQRLEGLWQQPLIRERLTAMNLRYIIWIDGTTDTDNSKGSLSCALMPGAAGCFGFATWEKTSAYEAVIWDVAEFLERGRVNVDAQGTSYLLAVGAPIPFIARVQGEACDSIGAQLRSFFEG